ncbi:retinol dehydrogenase 11 [Caerostris extrusa]|uniref:Retinol dehydrogenase 11 n=1 Tax=Caerostris extrusa TaxID=172846 RepID=A0AAV4R2R9_CAEEX|nr:retinol dehydrogenase 11 [Caerostris extrusa]
MLVPLYYASVDFCLRKHYRSSVKLRGKTVVITGGNTGIGREAILDLAGRGAKIIMACRDVEKGRKAVEYVRKQVPEANIIVKELDLSSFASIRALQKIYWQQNPTFTTSSTTQLLEHVRNGKQ